MNRPLLMFTGLWLTTAVQAQQTADPRAGRLDQYFSTLARVGRFNGIVVVAESGKVVYQGAFGPADFATGRPNLVTSPFPIASITKVITATAVLQLAERGKLELEDPVVKHLAGFPYPGITLKHLLSHTSGLDSYDGYFASVLEAHPDTVFHNADVIAQMARHPQPLKSEPGQRSRYNNLNFILLALVVEAASGQSFQQYVTEHILRPAGMSHTRWSPVYSGMDDPDLSIPHAFPTFYSTVRTRPDTVAYVARYWRAYRFQGFGELISTAQDLLAFDRALSADRLLSRISQERAYTPAMLVDMSQAPHGLGWLIAQDSGLGGRIVYHGGGQLGLRVQLMRNPAHDRVIIVFDNSQNEVDPSARAALKILNGGQVESPRRSLARLFGPLLVTTSPDSATRALEGAPEFSEPASVDEEELDRLGYELLEAERPAEALAVFAVNVRLFPGSWNVYDSYGEALAKVGRRAEAIAMYQRSLELNPSSAGGRAALERLRKP